MDDYDYERKIEETVEELKRVVDDCNMTAEEKANVVGSLAIKLLRITIKYKEEKKREGEERKKAEIDGGFLVVARLLGRA